MLLLILLLLCLPSSFPAVGTRKKRDNMRAQGTEGPPGTGRSPLDQGLPTCTAGTFKRIERKTTAKAIVCPMIRDEEGFLSEWVAYYQMHGFSHVMLFDDGSVDNGLAELQPWINSGFVSVKSNWTAETLKVHPVMLKDAFRTAMASKALLETECKLQAIKWGYDFQVSLDLDEYLIPEREGVTAVDELVLWMNTTGRPSYCMNKLNFPSTPHLLEPINLLTIEAYQTRVNLPGKMNYYTTVAQKCAYKLRSNDYRTNTSEYIAKCCHFHGCSHHDYIRDTKICLENHGEEGWRVSGKGKKWMDSLIINHYSRTLEKYALKGKTWKTSTGEAKAGENSHQAASSYDIPKFLARSVGWRHDPRALRYSCQLREILRSMTGEDPYMRPGLMWYRNPEYGRAIEDPDKRGRYGRPNAPGFKYNDPSPYNYHGKQMGEPQIDLSQKALVASNNKGGKSVAVGRPGKNAGAVVKSGVGSGVGVGSGGGTGAGATTTTSGIKMSRRQDVTQFSQPFSSPPSPSHPPI